MGSTDSRIAPFPRRTGYDPKARPPSHVLIVDDDPCLREISRHFLEADGYCVSEAASGKLAAEALMKDSFDVITTDLRMPAASGETLIQWILVRHPRMLSRILIVTGAPVSEEFEAFTSKLRIPVLRKPYEEAELRGAVYKIIESNSHQAS